MPELVKDGLRDCQIEAIEGIERSLVTGHSRSLVQMATGAGKTFTAATLCYRLLAHAGAQRIFFLVDRNNLGRQTLKEFQNYRPPGTGRSFSELYNAQRLGPAGIDPSSKVVISTIQRLFGQLSVQNNNTVNTSDNGIETQCFGIGSGVSSLLTSNTLNSLPCEPH